MTNREQFKRKVIELIHGLPYEEVIKKELIFGCEIKLRNDNQVWKSEFKDKKLVLKAWEKPFAQIGETDKYHSEYIDFSSGIENIFEIIGLPITIGRVMQALVNKKTKDLDNIILDKIQIDILRYWKLTNENGQECTDDDQTDETINKLLEIL